MQTTIYLVRHGHVHNPDAVFYERMEGFGLSDIGRQQAHTIGRILSFKSISKIYTSPLERTRQTAAIIASFHKNLEIIHDERLLEVRSPLRGKKMEDLAKQRWNFYEPKNGKHTGESLEDVWNRMNAFFTDITNVHKGQEIVVVSHGDPIMISMVKHRGKRLSLDTIRGEEYVDTGTGYQLFFDEEGIVDIKVIL